MERETVFGVTLPEIDGYRMAPLAPGDEPVVQSFIERCAENVQMLTGLPPGSSGCTKPPPELSTRQDRQ